jgi:hypothetical protein
LAYVLIGTGFLLASPGAGPVRVVGAMVLACGAVFFCSAIGYSLWSVVRRFRRAA